MTSMSFDQMQTFCKVIQNVYKGTIQVTIKYINTVIKSRRKTSEDHTSIDQTSTTLPS
jgi:predicted translin family RNA/ssDNA-binding protein